jgi:uncharacterized coiled-coil protein SlyX
MIEAVISAAVAGLTGLFAINTRLNNRIMEVDKRMDRMELRMAERYVPKEELSHALAKMEDHMVRIENKLDQIVFKHN